MTRLKRWFGMALCFVQGDYFFRERIPEGQAGRCDRCGRFVENF